MYSSNTVKMSDFLPADIVGIIFEYLRPRARLCLRLVCQAFNQALLRNAAKEVFLGSRLCIKVTPFSCCKPIRKLDFLPNFVQCLKVDLKNRGEIPAELRDCLLSIIAGLPQLTSLTICNCRSGQPKQMMMEIMLKKMRRLEFLTQLNLEDIRFERNEIEALIKSCKASNITSLKLEDVI